MDELLSKVNIRIRRYRPVMRKGEFYTVWRDNNLLQLTYKSRGCRNSVMGSCVMCDYGAGRNLTLKETKTVLPEVLQKGEADIEELVLNTYGSFLDEYEIPEENRKAILEQVAGTDIPYITFETHYRTITIEKIEEIQSYLGDKTIAYEVGLESVDPYVLGHCLNKEIDLEELEKCIELIHSYHHLSTVNILYGSPFLNEKQQVEDTLKSIYWAYEQGADVLVLFPVNIKPFTALEHLYKGGYYKPVSQWGFIKVLDSVPAEILEKITLAWYGNREIEYDRYEFKPIFPTDCEKCHDVIFEFYENFALDRSGKSRRRLLEKIKNTDMGCNCRERAWDAIANAQDLGDLRDRACEYLRKNILKDGKYAIPWKKF